MTKFMFITIQKLIINLIYCQKDDVSEAKKKTLNAKYGNCFSLYFNSYFCNLEIHLNKLFIKKCQKLAMAFKV